MSGLFQRQIEETGKCSDSKCGCRKWSFSHMEVVWDGGIFLFVKLWGEYIICGFYQAGKSHMDTEILAYFYDYYYFCYYYYYYYIIITPVLIPSSSSSVQNQVNQEWKVIKREGWNEDCHIVNFGLFVFLFFFLFKKMILNFQVYSFINIHTL